MAKTKTEKTAKTEKPAADKKPRVKRNKLDVMLTALTRAADTEARIAKAKAAADKTIAKARSSLVMWGKLPHDMAVTTADLIAHFNGLKSGEFVAPNTRVTVEPFMPGTKAEIVKEFLPSYAQVYAPEELNSMTYDFLDEVNKNLMFKTDTGRYIAAKAKHVQAKSAEAPAESAEESTDDVQI